MGSASLISNPGVTIKVLGMGFFVLGHLGAQVVLLEEELDDLLLHQRRLMQMETQRLLLVLVPEAEHLNWNDLWT